MTEEGTSRLSHVLLLHHHEKGQCSVLSPEMSHFEGVVRGGHSVSMTKLVMVSGAPDEAPIKRILTIQACSKAATDKLPKMEEK